MNEFFRAVSDVEPEFQEVFINIYPTIQNYYDNIIVLKKKNCIWNMHVLCFNLCSVYTGLNKNYSP